MNNDAALLYDGMTLSIKGTSDDFYQNLSVVSTHTNQDGTVDQRDNDVVDTLNYLVSNIRPESGEYPYLDSIDAYGHTFLSSSIVVEELNRLIVFARSNHDDRMVTKIERVRDYCKTVKDGHEILQFDGM